MCTTYFATREAGTCLDSEHTFRGQTSSSLSTSLQYSRVVDCFPITQLYGTNTCYWNVQAPIEEVPPNLESCLFESRDFLCGHQLGLDLPGWENMLTEATQSHLIGRQNVALDV